MAEVDPLAKDNEHLQILSIFHYVFACMVAVFASVPILHFAAGVAMVFMPSLLGDQHPLAIVGLMGWVFILLAGTWIVLGWSLAVCLVFAGLFLGRRTHYVFCLVIAALSAGFCIPVGTVLGIATILVLQRPSVKAAFERSGTTPPGLRTDRAR